MHHWRGMSRSLMQNELACTGEMPGTLQEFSCLGWTAWKVRNLQRWEAGQACSQGVSRFLVTSNLLTQFYPQGCWSPAMGREAPGTAVNLQVPLGFPASVLCPESPSTSTGAQTLVRHLQPQQ